MIFSVDIRSTDPLPEDEFWRDVDASNRCDDPKTARRFLSSLIIRRARSEAIERRIPAAHTEAFIKSRSFELWNRCRECNFPSIPILGFSLNFTLKLPEQD